MERKLETIPKSKVNTREDLAIAYTPGVAEPCKVIAENPEEAYTYTMKANTVAVVSDGSARFRAGEHRSLRGHARDGGQNASFSRNSATSTPVPICLDTQDTEEIIATVKNIAPALRPAST